MECAWLYMGSDQCVWLRIPAASNETNVLIMSHIAAPPDMTVTIILALNNII